MPESHERILRRIIRRFGSFPTRTYLNRISNDANVRITYEERSGRVLNLNKTCAQLIRRVPYVGVRWQIYGRVTGALRFRKTTFQFEMSLTYLASTSSFTEAEISYLPHLFVYVI